MSYNTYMKNAFQIKRRKSEVQCACSAGFRQANEMLVMISNFREKITFQIFDI